MYLEIFLEYNEIIILFARWKPHCDIENIRRKWILYDTFVSTSNSWGYFINVYEVISVTHITIDLGKGKVVPVLN
jgi:hypothetical protein